MENLWLSDHDGSSGGFAKVVKSSQKHVIGNCRVLPGRARSSVLRFGMCLRNRQNDSTCRPIRNIRLDTKRVKNPLPFVPPHFIVWQRKRDQGHKMSGRQPLVSGGLVVWLCCLTARAIAAQDAIGGDHLNDFLMHHQWNIQQAMMPGEMFDSD
jgi:hypothetical protein